MSGNVALRNRRRREHEEKRGGRSAKTSVVSVEVPMAMPVDAAMERARAAVREATGVEVDEEGTGALATGMFSELLVDVDVEPRSEGSSVRVALRTVGRNGGLAIVLLALAVLSIAGIVVYAIVSRGAPKEKAKRQAMAARIEKALLHG